MGDRLITGCIHFRGVDSASVVDIVGVVDFFGLSLTEKLCIVPSSHTPVEVCYLRLKWILYFFCIRIYNKFDLYFIQIFI